MALVNVEIINDKLVNAKLLEKRREFIINECELLRRQFEIHGVELSQELLDHYKKLLIVHNANIVWDLKALVLKRYGIRTYSGNRERLEYTGTSTYNIPIGIKSVDPITLSFMSLAEIKSIIVDHLDATWSRHMTYNSKDLKIVNKQLNTYSVSARRESTGNSIPTISYSPAIARPTASTNYSAILGAFDYFTNSELEAGLGEIYNSSVDTVNYYASGKMPLINYAINEVQFIVSKVLNDRATYLVQAFQNPTLTPKSLIPALDKMFASAGSFVAEYYPHMNFETFHFKYLGKYFEPFYVTDIYYLDKNLINMYGLQSYYRFATNHYDMKTMVSTVNALTQAEVDNVIALRNQQINTLSDTRSEYQKLFTYDNFKVSNWKIAEELVEPEELAMKKLIDSKGGSYSLYQNVFWAIAEAHASVNTTVNILNYDFLKQFKTVIVITDNRDKIMKAYIMLSNNYRVKYYRYGGNAEYATNLKGLVTFSLKDYAHVEVETPINLDMPFPYYHLENSSTNKSHLIKTPAFLGIQKLRNGFLYQDIDRAYSTTFVPFERSCLDQLENLVSKQVALYDILDDVKKGNIYTKAITTSQQKQPFNPMMPEYITVTTMKDVVKTKDGEFPLIHPETEDEISWKSLHAEMVIMSGFYYDQYIKTMTPTLNEYNNKIAGYLNNLIAEMKTLSTTYVEAEAQALKAEKERTQMEVALEKLRSGIFINDDGVEYWRKLTPEEEAEVNKMIAQIETNLVNEQRNAEIELLNQKYQEEADQRQIQENERIQLEADAEAIRLNEYYQEQANLKVIEANKKAQEEADKRQEMINQQIIEEDSQWKRDNIDNLVAPTIHELYEISRKNNCLLSDALIIWENEHPFYSYNKPLALEIDLMRQNIINTEVYTADVLIEAKYYQSKLAEAIIELFPNETRNL